MGSESIREMGLHRKGERLEGLPTSFTILDVDIPTADLLALYEGKPVDQAIIRGIEQTRRSKALASPEFVEQCRPGIGKAVDFYRLSAASDGVRYKVIDDGNNRCMAQRIINVDRVREGLAPRELLAFQMDYPSGEKAAGEWATERHALANCHARMLPSHSAANAKKLSLEGLSDESIRKYLDGYPPAEDVAALVILDGLIDPVKDAVDAGLVKLAAIVKLEGASEEKQAKWLAKRLAPKPERKPRASKPMQRRAVERIRSELMAPSGESSEDALIWELLSLVTGELEPGKIRSDKLRAAYLRATERGK